MQFLSLALDILFPLLIVLLLIFHFRAYLYLKKHYPAEYKEFHYRPTQQLQASLEDFIKQRPSLSADAELIKRMKLSRKINILFITVLVLSVIAIYIFHVPTIYN